MKALPEYPTPVLVCIDIQREYNAPGRPFTLNGIESALKNCRRVLAHAREERWPVAHVRHIQDSHLFNPKLPYSRFIEGFEPLPHEPVFTKHLFSCFSSPEFAEFIETTRHHPVFVMGFNAQMCVLSTLVDSMHRGMRLKLVGDATLSRASGFGDERTSHDFMLELLAIYADIVTTAAVLATSAQGSSLATQAVADYPDVGVRRS